MDDTPLELRKTKRIFDVCVSLVLLVLTSPLFLFFFLAIFIEHLFWGRPFAPLVYGEERISRGKTFRLYKFNIFDEEVLREHREKGTFIHTKHLEHQGHITGIGKVLRQIYLDELPQLFCVLTGDLSLVGPRPINREVFAHVESLGITPAQALVPAGITGTYQSYKGHGKKAFALDREYVTAYREKGSIALVVHDLSIILRTVKVVLKAEGR